MTHSSAFNSKQPAITRQTLKDVSSICFSFPDLWQIFILTGAISFWKLGVVHGVVYGLGPWTGSMGWSMDQVHRVVHGLRSMFCIRPNLQLVESVLFCCLTWKSLLDKDTYWNNTACWIEGAPSCHLIMAIQMYNMCKVCLWWKEMHGSSKWRV